MSLLVFKIFKSHNKTIYNSFQDLSVYLNNLIHEVEKLSKEEDSQTRSMICNKLIYLGKENNKKFHNMAIFLGSSYIVPFDREDVLKIIDHINDISSSLIVLAKRCHTFYTRNIGGDLEVQILFEKLLPILNEVSVTLESFPKIKLKKNNFTNSIDKINQEMIEFNNLIITVNSDLFENEMDFKNLFFKREVLLIFEKIEQKVKNYAFILESLIVKYK